jgi:hypothetical protein
VTLNPTRREFGRVLREAGFLQQAGDWYSGNNEIQIIVDLQKSNYSGEHYVNLGLDVRRPDLQPHPKVASSDIYIRVDSLIPGKIDPGCTKALNSDSAMSAEDRTEALSRLFETAIRPVLERVNTKVEFVRFVLTPPLGKLQLNLRCEMRIPGFTAMVSDWSGTASHDR